MGREGTLSRVLPITLLVGFLGSGKTTLLQRLLASGGAGRALVVVNEFGEVGLDGALLAKSGEGVIELPGGCLCCTVSGELVTTLKDLLARRRRRLLPLRFDRILIEASGLATPGPILRSLLMEEDLARELELSATVAAAAAPWILAQAAQHPEVTEQLALADLVVLTHSDRLSEPPDAILEELLLLAPLARVLNAADPSFDPCDLLAPAPAPDLLLARSEVASHTCTNSAPCQHTKNLRTVLLETTTPLDPHALDLWLRMLVERKAPRVLRLKGLLPLTQGGWIEVQGVGPFVEGRPASVPCQGPGRLVLIGLSLDPVELGRGWTAVGAKLPR